ncbi:hypothetical protein Dimus_009658 [Dionaea muscipula]
METAKTSTTGSGFDEGIAFPQLKTPATVSTMPPMMKEIESNELIYIIKLDANENPYGPPPECQGILTSLNVENIAKVVEQQNPKCIFLTSPNNPDGRKLPFMMNMKKKMKILMHLSEEHTYFLGTSETIAFFVDH